MFVVMNKEKWDKLPPDVQKVFEEVSREWVAKHGEALNIADAYEAEGFDFSGTRAFDARTGYRSKSFLTIPLEGKEGQIIGVLQLINAQDENGNIISFSSDDVLEALVMLAAAALDATISRVRGRRRSATHGNASRST